MGLSTAREMGVRKIRVIRDSNLVLSQVQGSFAVKEITLAPYRTMVEKLMVSFKHVVLAFILGITNRYIDTLATLGSKLTFFKEQPNITETVRRKLYGPGGKLNIKSFKEYINVSGTLYKHLHRGVLTQ
ncbi:hypothetical protein D8674_026504 [Pyrus ussuriensis x Pyrus communis]|uniref:RNase H type-1 domain-containing protein n=1 Tax=Pyrus ussuriensis x Pyrus communis TaxID=2448454 RepID=A0A5N5IE23_9ROSA|nr:hypothetical protein D8674_026504 [Pyrus ussuriensis x Pyrus communis]